MNVSPCLSLVRYVETGVVENTTGSTHVKDAKAFSNGPFVNRPLTCAAPEVNVPWMPNDATNAKPVECRAVY